MVALVINYVVLLNFIIAILAETYAQLNKSKLGLYYDGIISRIPVYEDDTRYGGLIVGVPPFSTLALPMIPVYLLVKDQKKLRHLNNIFSKFIFLPFAFFLGCIFVAMNLALLPFAYLLAIIRKLIVMREAR